jgi:hypothetical protein
MNIEYLLLTNKPIPITDKLYFHQHSMEEIEENIGFNHYEQIIFGVTREPYEFKFQFEEENIDYKQITYFNLFFQLCMNNQLIEFKNKKIKCFDRTIQVLNFMMDADFEFLQFDIKKNNVIDTFGFFDKKTNDVIYADNFYKLKDVLSKIFFIPKPKERFAANKMAKKLIMREMQLKSKEGIDNNIYSIISSLLWSPNCQETHQSIWKLTPYQIYNGYLTVEKIKNFDNTMNGYYHGTVNRSDLNIQNIHWTKKII